MFFHLPKQSANNMQKPQKIYNIRAKNNTVLVNSLSVSIVSNILFELNPDLVLEMHFYIVPMFEKKKDNVLWNRFNSYRANLLHHIVWVVYQIIDT